MCEESVPEFLGHHNMFDDVELHMIVVAACDLAVYQSLHALSLMNQDRHGWIQHRAIQPQSSSAISSDISILERMSRMKKE